MQLAVLVFRSRSCSVSSAPVDQVFICCPLHLVKVDNFGASLISLDMVLGPILTEVYASYQRIASPTFATDYPSLHHSCFDERGSLFSIINQRPGTVSRARGKCNDSRPAGFSNFVEFLSRIVQCLEDP
jgi:hypothetical protein